MEARDVNAIVVLDDNNQWLYFSLGDNIISAIREARKVEKDDKATLMVFLVHREIEVVPGEEV